MLHSTFLKTIVIAFTLFGSLLLNAKDYQYYSPTSKDIKGAKYLEDFYWNFRSNRISRAKRSLKRLKMSKSKRIKSFAPLLTWGLKNRHNQICEKKNGRNHLEKKYYRLFYNRCLSQNVKRISLADGDFKPHEKEFISNHIKNIFRTRFRTNFINRIKSLNTRNRIYISNQIKNYIFSFERIPHRDFLPYLITDSAITRFIQSKKLLDNKDNRIVTQEFKSLIDRFKDEYLNGEQDKARELLTQSIQFYEFNQDQINNSKAWKLFVLSGKKLARKNDYDLALELFKASESIAHDDQLMESKFHTLFTYYRNSQYAKAKEYINKERFIDSFDILSPRLRYWSAFVLHKNKEFKTAKELYIRAINLNPLNFYSIISLKNLRRLSPNYGPELIIKEAPKNLPIKSISHYAKEQIILFDIFTKAQSDFLANLQALEIRKMSVNSFFDKANALTNAYASKKYISIELFNYHDNHLQSFREAYSGLKSGQIKLNSLVAKNLFPQKYKDVINKVNKDIDPKVIFSLIRQESAFNHEAKSVVGARGLMQIMPATGAQFVKNLKVHNLYKPHININIGVTFLERLLKKYDGNLIYALSAYNAGMGNVAKWQNMIPFGDDMMANIEMIPFDETKNYIKYIYRNLFFYRYNQGESHDLDRPNNDTFFLSLN